MGEVINKGIKMNEKPLLTAQQMAEFTMTPSFTKDYRQRNLTYLGTIHGAEYVENVKKLMLEIHRKVKK